MSWLGGFLSGVNVGHDGLLNDALKDLDLQAHLAWIEKYCRENPLDSFSRASTRLLLEIMKVKR